jgi:hypothetical protein
MTSGPDEAVFRPGDSDLVQSAIRLGWSVAEVRGRNRPGGPHGAVLSLPAEVDEPLPLRIQRTPDELRIEAQAVLGYLALKIDVDMGPGAAGYGVAIDEAARALAEARRGGPERLSRGGPGGVCAMLTGIDGRRLAAGQRGLIPEGRPCVGT